MPDEAAVEHARLPLRADLLRAGLIVLASASLGLLINGVSLHPVPILDPQGPGYRAPPAASISIEDLLSALSAGRAVLLDARSETEFRSVRAANAWRVTLDGFFDEYAQIKPFLVEGQVLVVLCDTEACPTGNLIVKWLNRLGHADARIVAGGWEAYRKAGLPTEESKP